jgi:hypothetical protein
MCGELKTSGFGTFRIWTNVRLESVMRFKADICRAASAATGRGPGNRYACRSGPEPRPRFSANRTANRTYDIGRAVGYVATH